MRKIAGAIVTVIAALGIGSCTAPSKPRLYDERGEPIVGKIETRYETIDLTAEELDARTESGHELREMRAEEIMADVDPELPSDI
ncbi:MAG: hypothetical protein ACOCUS_01595 [Polyangiales bacterium]